ncbi:ABC transporter permease [Lactococcus allomyrinae]|uniref:ABC transporter permease n=1 Tax=Lactococcus allomyrinae TaxID=2419773 RepID=A0A387BIP0_9LACT|nr:ABC transporter permease [Lactococcus allomyrinae]AYG01219.1 ABC transporter permease [Lactococcus allomyrinae]
MTVSNIFKMEMYRNFRDRAYLIVISILTVSFAIAASLGIAMIFQAKSGHETAPLIFLEGPLVFALFIAFAAFSIIYPWHLMSTDYNNKVLSLVVASGVKRSRYYFVKLLATIVTNLLAYFVIGVIPVVLLLGFFHQEFIDFVQTMIHGFTANQGWLLLLNLLVSSIATMVILYFVVILTRGKFWGVFVFLGIRLGLGVVVSSIGLSIASVSGSLTSGLLGNHWLDFAVSLIEIIIFGFAGLLMLKKQDL